MLVPTVQRAVALWNALTPTTGNFFEIGDPTRFDGLSAVLHELGHCAMGLDHIDDETYFLVKSSILDTAPPDNDNGIPGDSEDLHIPIPGSPNAAQNLHFFRTIDNDPVVIDSLVIDTGTFKRAATPTNLPSGHRGAASANQLVAALLGAANTQDVMLRAQAPEDLCRGLIADNVNTVKLGMAGLDDQAGTADDYTVRVEYQASCEGADVEVRFGMLPPEKIAACTVLTEVVSGKHYRVKPLPGLPFFLTLSEDEDWQLEEAPDPIFVSGFETGTFLGWSEVVQ